MSAYEKLTCSTLRRIVDEKAAALVEARGITLEEAREQIAAGIRTVPARPTPRGH